ncbi:MAG TPA: DUF2877 domain-containing protein [Anaerolineae bacterium]|nr:DUF2877 domain-containing protein [Anaerolineae bacterium]
MKSGPSVSPDAKIAAGCEAPHDRGSCTVNPGVAPEWKNPRVPVSTLYSISTPLVSFLEGYAGRAVLLGQFARAVNVGIRNRVVALVLPAVGNGPFHLVVDALPEAPLPRELPVSWERAQLRLGSWRVQLTEAALPWEPRVPWEQLRLDGTALRCLRASVESAMCARGAWQESAVFPGRLADARRLLSTLEAAYARGADEALVAAAAALAGWGPGLTPAGDDFLAGLLLALWAQRGEAARPLCTAIAAVAIPRTTRLSGAFLQAAAEGLADQRWHVLLQALTGASDAAIEAAAQAVLAFGATSGPAMLAGFLRGMGNG